MPFDRQPTLQGVLVNVRPLHREDHAAMFAVASDPLIWEQHPVKTRSEEEGFKDFFEESLASGGALLVFDAKTDKPLKAEIERQAARLGIDGLADRRRL